MRNDERVIVSAHFYVHFHDWHCVPGKHQVYSIKRTSNVVEGQLAYVQMCNDDFYDSLLLGLFSSNRYQYSILLRHNAIDL
jgi:hypothetical protein